MQKYKNYINQRCLQGSQYHQDVINYESQIGQNRCQNDIINFIDFLAKKNEITEEYCYHFSTYFKELFYSQQYINRATYNQYIMKLDFYAAKSNYNQANILNKGITQYKINNFIHKENILLEKVQDKGGSVYLNDKGNICVRLSINSNYKECTLSQASVLISNFVSLDIKFINSIKKNTKKDSKDYIHTNNLLLVQGEIFDTTQYKEFVEIDGVYYRNTFRPSKMLALNKQPQTAPINIFNLILHLVNYDLDRYFAFMNWLAYFVQYLKKSQTTILFKGTQGAGKGTLFKIISELFGKEYCKQINGDSLKSNYLGAFIENTLFINFDEISYKTIGKSSFSSFLKALITNEEITSEKKGINLSEPTKISAQTILFSNDDNPVEIEESDRRFTVFTTAGNIQTTNFFGNESFKLFENAIDNEIEDFAMYLKLFIVNKEHANLVYNTPEKDLMVNRTENNLQQFVDAMFNQDWDYFKIIQTQNCVLHDMFIRHLINARIYQKHLILVYTLLYPQDKYIESAKTLIKYLERIAPQVFGEHNLQKSNGSKYYKLELEDPMYKPYYNC